jgi:hypothetical protein
VTAIIGQEIGSSVTALESVISVSSVEAGLETTLVAQLDSAEAENANMQIAMVFEDYDATVVITEIESTCDEVDVVFSPPAMKRDFYCKFRKR